MGAWRWMEIDCPCCAKDCPLTCFRLVGCGINFAGAVVEVYESGVPGTVLASGTIDVMGMACMDLGAFVGRSLRWRSDPRPADFIGLDLAIPAGDPCGKTFGAELAPASTTGGGGVAGNLTVTLRRNDDSLVTSGQSRVYLTTNLVTPIAVATHGAGGIATFTGLPTGVSLVFNSGPTSSASQTFPAFTLTCEGSALAKEADEFGAGQTWSLTPIGCGTAIPKCCCTTCFPDTIPCNLFVNDPTSLLLYNEARACGNPNYLSSCSAFANRTLPMTRGCSLSGQVQCWSANDFGDTGCLGFGLNYTMTCESDGIYLTKNQGQFAYATSLGNGFVCTSRQPTFRSNNQTLCALYQLPLTNALFWPSGAVPYIPSGSGGLTYPKVKAISVTCDPFTATFLMPEFIVPLWTATPIPGNFLFCTYSQCGTCTIPSHIVTVYE